MNCRIPGDKNPKRCLIIYSSSCFWRNFAGFDIEVKAEASSAAADIDHSLILGKREFFS